MSMFRNILADSRLRAHQVLWNQQADRITSSFTGSNVVCSDNKALFTITSSGSIYNHYYNQTHTFDIINGHKYFIANDFVFNFVGNPTNIAITFGTINTYHLNGPFVQKSGHFIVIREGSYTNSSLYRVLLNYTNPRPNGGTTVEVSNPMLVDLTKMFGAGNEPATSTEAWRIIQLLWADNPEGMYDYNSTGTPMWYYA